MSKIGFDELTSCLLLAKDNKTLYDCIMDLRNQSRTTMWKDYAYDLLTILNKYPTDANALEILHKFWPPVEYDPSRE